MVLLVDPATPGVQDEEESSGPEPDMFIKVLSSMPGVRVCPDGVTGIARLFGERLEQLDPELLFCACLREELGDLCLSNLELFGVSVLPFLLIKSESSISHSITVD